MAVRSAIVSVNTVQDCCTTIDTRSATKKGRSYGSALFFAQIKSFVSSENGRLIAE